MGDIEKYLAACSAGQRQFALAVFLDQRTHTAGGRVQMRREQRHGGFLGAIERGFHQSTVLRWKIALLARRENRQATIAFGLIEEEVAQAHPPWAFASGDQRGVEIIMRGRPILDDPFEIIRRPLRRA